MQVERAEVMVVSQRGCVERVWQQAAGVELVGLVEEEQGSLSRSRWPAKDWQGWAKSCGCPDQCL